MQLPAALQSWSGELGLFAADLQWPLGGVVQKLASVIGPLAVSHSAWDGEPDGFDGLARRGPYDRLLATEWLLAEEAPEEFVRRAAMSEHVFLRLARPEPSGDRLTIALFDAGASQLGTPRLVHLALLILLARRAEAANARFGWGIVQSPDDPLLSVFDEQAVTRLLDARTADVPSAAHVAAWQARIGSWPRLDESWWIGGAPLGRLVPGRASRVTIEDLLEPGVRRLEAQVRIPGRLPAAVPLDLPPDDACTRLLRDPFGRALAVRTRLETVQRPQSNMLFSFDGHKLLARSGTSRVLAYAIPNSPRAKVGPPRTYETYRRVVAAGRYKRALLVATRHADGLQINTYGKDPPLSNGAVYRESGGAFVAPADGSIQPLWVRPDFAKANTVQALTLDAGQNLFGLSSGSNGRTMNGLADGVLAAMPWSDGLLIAHRATNRGQDGVWLSAAGESVEPQTLLALDAQGVLFGRMGAGGTDPGLGPLAFNSRGREWAVRLRDRQMVLIAPEGTTVVGVAQADGNGEPGLVVIEPGGRKVTLLGRNWERGLAQSSGPILHATFDGLRGLMAFTTRDELVIFSIDSRQVLLRAPLA
jgi:hypothetical protein